MKKDENMKPQNLYEELKKEIDGVDKVLFLGNRSLLHALYIAGKSREKGKQLKAKAIVPPDSKVKSEEKAIKTSEEKAVKEGTPNTYYRVGNIEMEDEEYPLIVDFRENPLKQVKGTIKKLSKNGKILMKLPEEYLYLVKTTSKGLFKKKEKIKNTKKAIEDLKFKLESYKVLGTNEVLVKVKEKGFKKPYLNLEPLPLDEVGEKIADETLPHAEYAMEGSSFCVESDDSEYLYVFEEIKNREEKPLKFQFKFLTGETTYEKGKKKKRNKEFKVKVLPNLPRFREQVKSQDKLIIPKKRIKDYYT